MYQTQRGSNRGSSGGILLQRKSALKPRTSYPPPRWVVVVYISSCFPVFVCLPYPFPHIFLVSLRYLIAFLSPMLIYNPRNRVPARAVRPIPTNHGTTDRLSQPAPLKNERCCFLFFFFFLFCLSFSIPRFRFLNYLRSNTNHHNHNNNASSRCISLPRSPASSRARFPISGARFHVRSKLARSQGDCSLRRWPREGKTVPPTFWRAATSIRGGIGRVGRHRIGRHKPSCGTGHSGFGRIVSSIMCVFFHGARVGIKIPGAKQSREVQKKLKKIYEIRRPVFALSLPTSWSVVATGRSDRDAPLG
ncbi:hypothetical protein VTH06DRAFT_751 [Thermothelomyces fergusii]